MLPREKQKIDLLRELVFSVHSLSHAIAPRVISSVNDDFAVHEENALTLALESYICR